MAFKGLQGGRYKVLEEEQVRKIHDSALEVLERVGIKVEADELLNLLEQNGARVDGENKVAKIPGKMVESALEVVPKQVKLYGRKEEYMLDLSDNKVHLGTGGAAIKIVDLDTGKVRPSKLEDQANLARLVESLENIHFFQCPVVPRDIPKERLSLNSFYAALTNTYKNVQESATSVEAVRDIIEMASMIAGGEDKLCQAPFISFVISWMISPLKLDIRAAEVLQEVVKHKIPVALSSAPVTGSTAPATLAGLLTQVHAEELSGIVLTQLFSEGSPVLYGPVPGAANMRDMSYLGGAIEAGLMNAAAVQLANHINVPIYSDAGLTESKLPDIQAGYEKAANIIQVALAGGNYIHHAAGMLEFMTTVAYEQYVLDNDVIGMAMRALQGIDVNEETLALDVIERVGPGGNFLAQKHTVKYCRSSEFFIPEVADRNQRDKWEEKGGLDARERARQRVHEILAKPKRNLIPEDVDKVIRERFEIYLPPNDKVQMNKV